MFGEGKDEVGNIMNQECRIMFREIRKKRNKVDALRVCDKVCFTVYGNVKTVCDEILPK